MQTLWKGAVSFGLVNVPVKMYTATQENDIPMRMLHKEHKVPIHYSRTCPKCAEEVKWSDIVKGYEYEPGKYVTFEKEELEELASETSREIRILDFVDLEEIDPIYFQKTYYLAPEETGTHAYGLLVEALKSTEKIGIANIALRGKGSLAALRVIGDVLSLVTLYYEEEIREKEEIPNFPEPAKVDKRELEMAMSLIEQLSAPFDPGKYEDEYRERLLQAIEQKVEGREITNAPEEKEKKVVNLMEALQASLNEMKAAQSTDRGTQRAPASGQGKPKTRRAKPRSKRTGA
ncbi:non-homologous end joining protein Ku [Paenibacillus caseinilyticus]|uniref:Non-homologous end joining protein Ku n=1 Tax=Paenibacillus mucilaginosus K02 TaxID=997761 RepID=I0BNS8_9BACL|nr:Ku protein [Paenibacillus mucilaginosus]AFH64025.1 DNA repair protein [Paenibacillus mucilaginosus K02]